MLNLRVFREAIVARYGLDSKISWEDAEEFLSILAVRLGKLKKGGEPDISTAARISKRSAIRMRGAAGVFPFILFIVPLRCGFFL